LLRNQISRLSGTLFTKRVFQKCEILVHRILELADIGIKSDNRLSLRCEIVDHLQLVDLTECSGKSPSISDGERELLEFLSFADDRLHLLLDILELRFFESGITEVDIIVPTRIDIRSDC
jgi:hypothetical protein